MKLHILHDSIYMILYKILYIISYSALYIFCSHVAKVARLNVCIACVREQAIVFVGGDTIHVSPYYMRNTLKGSMNDSKYYG